MYNCSFEPWLLVNLCKAAISAGVVSLLGLLHTVPFELDLSLRNEWMHIVFRWASVWIQHFNSSTHCTCALLPSRLAGVCCHCLSGITISATKIWELWLFEYLALTIVLSFSVTFAGKVTYVLIPNPMPSSTLNPVSHLRKQVIFPYKHSIFIITQVKKCLYSVVILWQSLSSIFFTSFHSSVTQVRFIYINVLPHLLLQTLCLMEQSLPVICSYSSGRNLGL